MQPNDSALSVAPGAGQEVPGLALPPADLVAMYRMMWTIREFELMADRLYAAGKVHGTMHLSAGQEAVAVGLARAVRPDDYLINHHRGHGHFLAKGADLAPMMAEFLGKANGYCRGRGGSMHIADFAAHNLGANGIVGAGIPQAVGVGLGLQMQGRDQIVVTVFGDGAANEGVFHEALNMAALWQLPIVYVCENNQYGMSMPVARASARLPIAGRAEAYGIAWRCVDGNDVLEVYRAMLAAAEHARRGAGPVLVETLTYRYFGHSKSDRNLYRTKDEIERWRARDPIARFEQVLQAAGVLTASGAESVRADARAAVEQAAASAEAAPEPDPATLMDFVYA